jgi:hypothetical protein
MSQVRNTFFDDWGSDFVKTVKGEALGLTDMATGFAKQMSDPFAMLKNGAAIFDATREDGLLAGWDEASKRLNPVDGIVRGFQAGYTAAMNNDPERAGRALLPAAAQTVMLIEGASQLAKGGNRCCALHSKGVGAGAESEAGTVYRTGSLTDAALTTVDGEAVRAICGRWFVPTRSPENLPICLDRKTVKSQNHQTCQLTLEPIAS